MKLNNKGMTAIEVLVCFSIISVVIVSMLKVVTNLREKEETESYKNVVNTYKNTTMRPIESDIIKHGYVSEITYLNNEWSDENLGTITASFTLSDGTSRTIIIKSNMDNEAIHSNITYAGKVFQLEKMEGLEFDKPYVMELTGDKGTHIFKIHVGFNQFDIGDKFEALDIVLPFSDSAPH